MQLSISSVCLGGGLVDKLEAIAAAGFAHVEIFESDLLSYNGSPADIRKLAADLGLTIIAFQPFHTFEGMPPVQRERIFARAERKFDLMQHLGCDLLVVSSNTAAEALPGIERAAADLNELGQRAAKRGLRIGYKAVANGRHIKSYLAADEAVRRAAHASAGLVLDSSQTFALKTDLAGIGNIPRNRIFMAQIADAASSSEPLHAGETPHTSFPGQGDLPLAEFMGELLATGYDGPLSLEIFNDQFRSSTPRSIAVDGYRSLVFLLDQLRLKEGTKAPPNLPVLPPPSKCAVEFIEFAIDKSGAAAFEKLVRGLGFTQSGTHVSKSVTRWSQGAINLVINTEKEGFAHSYNITRGTAVCAIGLKVDDASAVLDRATKLKDTPFSQAVAPGELKIPAIRGVGGSLLYFIDQKSELARVWSLEFKPTIEPSSKSDAGLLSIDHISQTMHYDEVLTWLLFYTSLFDLAKLPEQIVRDPGGAVKSQVLQSADENIRIVLNASQSPHAQSSRFLWEAFGAGVQHIAFQTQDIIATAERLEANGLAMLPVPENYYDDLELKTDLSVAEITELKAHNILYDRDAAGAFYQIYTRTFDQRFFFEIVERRGYKGMGAVNAPIRLASQARLDSAAL